jgi:dTDP-4-dehydrorhamnose reductase
MGRTYSTLRLAYQAEFENEQRWLSNDLLCERVNRDHPLYERLIGSGIRQEELEFFSRMPRLPTS